MTQTPYSPPAPAAAPPFGPYETERQALAEPMPSTVKDLHDRGLVPSGDPGRIVFAVMHNALLNAAVDAGVQLGALDRGTLAWLCRWEPSTVQVVIGLLARAHAAGKAAGTADVERAIAIEARVTAPHGNPVKGECGSCGEVAPDEARCPNSRRPCGHHCNHVWTQDSCCWCGSPVGEAGS